MVSGTEVDDEIRAWEEFIRKTKLTKAQYTVVREAVDYLSAGNVFNFNNALLDGYRYIAANGDLERFLASRLACDVDGVVFPKSDYFQAQFEISAKEKPKVGDIALREMGASRDDDGLVHISLVRAEKTERGSYVLKLHKSAEGWVATSNRARGIAVFVDEEPKQDWAYVEIVQVQSRCCKGIFGYSGLEDRIKKRAAASAKHTERRPSLFGVPVPNKDTIRVEVEW